MFSLTHQKIIDEVINAHKRGVYVSIYLDKSMQNGRLKSKITKLIKAKVPIYIREKQGLLHHKSALVDNTFIFGSTNWSQAGFTKNEETLLILNNIDHTLKKSIQKFLKNTKYYSKSIYDKFI